MNPAEESQDKKPARGQPIAGRKVLENLNFGTRTTGEAAAARSRMVRRLRVALPSVAFVLAVAFIYNTRTNSVDDAFLDDFADLTASTEDLRMASPRFDGIDENGNPFEITADSAKQNPEKKDVVELEKPKATQGAPDRRTKVVAEKGYYRTEEKVLELTDSVELEHKFADNIYVLKLPSAVVSIDEETVVSDSGVGGEGSDGAMLRADRMTAYNADRRVVFDGNVHMRIYPKSAEALEKETGEDEENSQQ